MQTVTFPADADSPFVSSAFFRVVTRLTQSVSGLFYALIFMLVYRSYISVAWGYTGLIYEDMTGMQVSFIAVLIAIVSWFMPIRVDRGSSVILWLLYAFVFVPTACITFMIGRQEPGAYVPSLIAFAAGMSIASYVSELPIRDAGSTASRISPRLGYGFMLVAGVTGFTLFYVFRDILSFSALDDVYYQRFAASEVSGGPIGYVRTYFAYVMCPGLIAVGLCEKQLRYAIAMGLAGVLLVYFIEAAKAILILPIAMFAIALLLRLKRNTTTFMTSSLSLLTAVCGLLNDQFTAIRIFVDLLLVRSIAIPAQTFSQYYDLFSVRGFTWWSNVKGINLVLPPPPGHIADPFWPVLGYIVGAEYYGFDSRMNANANLFVGEGVAAGGWIGVLVISLLLAAYLRTVDRLSSGWDPRFPPLIMVPIGLCLTNGHLSTILLSFGGFFWVLLLWLGRQRHKDGATS